MIIYQIFQNRPGLLGLLDFISDGDISDGEAEAAKHLNLCGQILHKYHHSLQSIRANAEKWAKHRLNIVAFVKKQRVTVLISCDI